MRGDEHSGRLLTLCPLSRSVQHAGPCEQAGSAEGLGSTASDPETRAVRVLSQRIT